MTIGPLWEDQGIKRHDKSHYCSLVPLEIFAAGTVHNMAALSWITSTPAQM